MVPDINMNRQEKAPTTNIPFRLLAVISGSSTVFSHDVNKMAAPPKAINHFFKDLIFIRFVFS